MDEAVDPARRGTLSLIESERFQEAAEFARQSLEEFPNDPELTMLMGLALVQSGQIDYGTAQLKFATELDPTNAQSFHNLAVALLNQGDVQEAAVHAREAIRLDPQHEEAMQTLAKCEAEKEDQNFEIAADPGTSETVEVPVEYSRPGPDDQPVHVLHLGEAWTRVGFALCAYCVISFTFFVFHPPLGDGATLKRDPVSMLSVFLYVTPGIATLVWTLIDIIDRREKFVWLLPMFVCGFVSLPVLPLSLYLAFRKKMIQLP